MKYELRATSFIINMLVDLFSSVLIIKNNSGMDVVSSLGSSIYIP